MDFLERIFHLNLDRGSGLTESLVLLTILALVAIVFLRQKPTAAGRLR